VSQDSLEDAVGCLRLVVWNLLNSVGVVHGRELRLTFVTSLEDSSKGEVADLTDLAADVRAIGDDIGVSCVCEFLGVAMLDCETECFTTEPWKVLVRDLRKVWDWLTVAAVVSISMDE
jgi:hypothetical protein